MSPISTLNALIKRFKPRRYTTLRVEFPIILPPDFSNEYSDSDYVRMFSAEIESKALAVRTALVNHCNITPKRLRGTIVPSINTLSPYRDKIIIKCNVPEDTPTELIRDVLVQTFKGNCTLFI